MHEALQTLPGWTSEVPKERFPKIEGIWLHKTFQNFLLRPLTYQDLVNVIYADRLEEKSYSHFYENIRSLLAKSKGQLLEHGLRVETILDFDKSSAAFVATPIYYDMDVSKLDTSLRPTDLELWQWACLLRDEQLRSRQIEESYHQDMQEQKESAKPWRRETRYWLKNILPEINETEELERRAITAKPIYNLKTSDFRDKDLLILRSLADGQSVEYISQDLSLSKKILYDRLRAIYNKTGARNKAHLSVMAAELFKAAPPLAVNGQNFKTLSKKEIQTIAGLIKGFSNRDIARYTRVAPATAERHLERILKKLSLNNRTQLALYAYDAYKKGLIAEPPDRSQLVRKLIQETYEDQRL